MPTAIVVHQVVDDALWAKVWEAVTRFSRPTLSAPTRNCSDLAGLNM
jgi:hypothetical protein